MGWDNYGFGENKWNVDHIIPLSKINLSDRKQLLKAVNYKNLQPLWQLDNIIKGKILMENQELHCFWCKTKVDRLITINNEKICTECLTKHVCMFCDPPVLNTICPGHEVLQSQINRFATDKEFTDNMRFEYESGNAIGPIRK